ncbi:MAG: hypothetical protein ABSD58_02985 [Verrucomicrobiia bacterium]|jgi:hypothetical protein
MDGKVGNCVEVVDVERVLPIGTTQEKRLRFEWEQKPSEHFLMSWNQYMEPNSLFVEDISDEGITVTVRWALMKETPEQIAARFNRWLEQVEEGKYRHSGISGRHL